MVRGTTEEERQQIIEYFCSICDRYKPGKSCGVGGTPWFETKHRKYGEDQERYAMRGWCGWATVGGRYATINHQDGEELVKFKDAETIKRSDLKNTSSK